MSKNEENIQNFLEKAKPNEDPKNSELIRTFPSQDIPIKNDSDEKKQWIETNGNIEKKVSNLNDISDKFFHEIDVLSPIRGTDPKTDNKESNLCINGYNNEPNDQISDESFSESSSDIEFVEKKESATSLPNQLKIDEVQENKSTKETQKYKNYNFSPYIEKENYGHNMNHSYNNQNYNVSSYYEDTSKYLSQIYTECLENGGKLDYLNKSHNYIPKHQIMNGFDRRANADYGRNYSSNNLSEQLNKNQENSNLNRTMCDPCMFYNIYNQMQMYKLAQMNIQSKNLNKDWVSQKDTNQQKAFYTKPQSNTQNVPLQKENDSLTAKTKTPSTLSKSNKTLTTKSFSQENQKNVEETEKKNAANSEAPKKPKKKKGKKKNKKKVSPLENEIKQHPEEYLVEMFGRMGWICMHCNNFNYESKL